MRFVDEAIAITFVSQYLRARVAREYSSAILKFGSKQEKICYIRKVTFLTGLDSDVLVALDGYTFLRNDREGK